MKKYIWRSPKKAQKSLRLFSLWHALHQGKTTSYDLNATREVHTFRNHDTAEFYHATIEKIIEKNVEDENKQIFFSFNEKLLENFYKNSR